MDSNRDDRHGRTVAAGAPSVERRSVVRNGRAEPRWPASLAVLGALTLYLLLPPQLTPGPKWVLPGLEVALVLPLTVFNPDRSARESSLIRTVSVVLVALINVANVGSLALLVHFLLYGGRAQGRPLIYSAVAIWLTNIIIFALWYWELDRGVPSQRSQGAQRAASFLFPQMTGPGIGPEGWSPAFVDYLYVSFTNATALSPTDTMPLSRWAKMLMLVQALASLVTVALVAARAVNILN